MKLPHITLHWLENSRAQRILWLLEELELPYTIKKYTRDPVTLSSPPALRKVHPLGKSPAITIEDGTRTVTLAESGAIIELLVEQWGNDKLGALPTGDLQERANYLYFLHFAEGSLMTPRMIEKELIRMAKRASGDEVSQEPVRNAVESSMDGFVNPLYKKNFDLLEQFLKDREFFGGSRLSGADIILLYPIQILEITLGYREYPLCRAWLDKMMQRPAFNRAITNGSLNEPALLGRWDHHD
ncbi:glutathione S-transferase domain protein [Meredithblackwellia eburnea MCA 4105]